MKQYLNKAVSGVAGLGLFLAACVMAGIGLSVMFTLALFALAALGLGILAAPLLALAQTSDTDEAKPAAA